MQLRFRSDVSFLETATSREKFRYGVVMWFLLFFGYMVFCTNWIIMGKLEGGWGGKFGISGSGSGNTGGRAILESVNYTIPLARGMATIPVAWLMVKLSHKWAVLIALFLNTAAFPLVFAPNLTLFIVGRMIMACGGTMLIIFVQPVLARFFNLKQKGILSIFTSWAYVLGALIANFVFLNKSNLNALNGKWQLIAAMCGLCSFLPFFWYMLFAKNFKTTSNFQEEIDQSELPENTYSGIIREKDLWFWILWYSFLLVASVMISNFTPNILEKIDSDLLNNGTGSWDWKSLYTICFYIGCLFGFSLGRWNKTEYRRKPFIVMCCLLGLVFWLAILNAALHLKGHYFIATGIIFTCIFLFAFFSMGVQTVILYVPHEYPQNNNAKRITIFYSYLWGMGYIIFAIYYLITSIVFDVQAFYGPRVALIMSTLFVALFGIFSLFIKEPRPDWKMHPWDKSFVPLRR